MDELYVTARSVLLDALEALDEHREATILVGAQAIYLHTAAADLGVAEHTTDADLVLDPALLGEIPPLERALEAAGFHGSTSTIGIWKTRRRTSQARDIDVQVDLLVPATVSPGSGRRAARLVGHGVHAARKVDGLEGVLVDQVERDIASLEPDVDGRVVRAKVAGPGALLVAKLFKIHERRGSARANDKDALDVLRVLRAIPTDDLGRRIRDILADPRSATVGGRALEMLDELFANRGSAGAVMAARAAQPAMDLTSPTWDASSRPGPDATDRGNDRERRHPGPATGPDQHRPYAPHGPASRLRPRTTGAATATDMAHGCGGATLARAVQRKQLALTEGGGAG